MFWISLGRFAEKMAIILMLDDFLEKLPPFSTLECVLTSSRNREDNLAVLCVGGGLTRRG